MRRDLGEMRVLGAEGVAFTGPLRPGLVVLRPRITRIAIVGLSLAYALTVLVGAIGEWNYYVLGSSVEVVLLGAVAYSAWTWPRVVPSPAATGPVVAPHAMGAATR